MAVALPLSHFGKVAPKDGIEPPTYKECVFGFAIGRRGERLAPVAGPGKRGATFVCAGSGNYGNLDAAMADTIETIRAKWEKSKARNRRLVSRWNEAGRPLSDLIDTGLFGRRGDDESDLEIAVRVMKEQHDELERQEKEIMGQNTDQADELDDLQEQADTLETKMSILESASKGASGAPEVEEDGRSVTVRAWGQVFECEKLPGHQFSAHMAWEHMGRSLVDFLRGPTHTRYAPRIVPIYVYPDQVPTQDDTNGGVVVAWIDGEWTWGDPDEFESGQIWRSVAVPDDEVFDRSAELAGEG